ncbi:MAG: hypothetical protein AABW86_00855 [Candidatus Micrarchaeota archaeon]
MAGEKTITVGILKEMGFNLEIAKDGTTAKMTGPTSVDTEMFGMLRGNIKTALGNVESNSQIPSGSTALLMRQLEKDAAKVTLEMAKAKEAEKGPKATEGGPQR